MMRRLLLVALALVPVMLPGWAYSAKPMLDQSVLGKFARDLGMSTPTAQGALGSMLMLTQRRVETGQFQQVVEYIPDWVNYINTGRDMGAFAESISTPDELAAAYKKLGLTPDQSSKFEAGVIDYIEKSAGPEAAQILRGALR